MVNTVTIRVRESTRSKLDGQKIHPRETYDDLITRIIGELSPVKNQDEASVKKAEEKQ